MKPILIAALVVIFFTGCKKDKGGSSSGGPDTTIKINPYTSHPVTASVNGLVVNENDLPVSGALVKSGSRSTVTNTKGLFSFTSIPLDQFASEVSAELTGYFKAYRVFQSREKGDQFVKIKLIPEKQVGTTNATSGGQVTLPDASSVNISPSSLSVKGTNQTYSGTVKVMATSIDPTSSDIQDRVPGSFEAVNSNNDLVNLKSFGMLAVELRGQNNEQLQLSSGKTAKLKFAIPASLSGQAPATIPLWSVDETTGLWKQEGTATRNGNFYEGDVPHFSYWNADLPNPSISLCMTLKTKDSLPLIAKVNLVPLDESGHAGGITDSTGYISGMITAGQKMKLTVDNACDQQIFEETVGPFYQNTCLGSVVVNAPTSNSVNFSGKVTNCSGQPVTDGYVEIHLDFLVFKVPINNGQFSLTSMRCPGVSTASLFAVDNVTRQQSAAKSFTTLSDQMNIGTLQACGTASDNFVNYTIDATSFTVGNNAGDFVEAATSDISVSISGFSGSQGLLMSCDATSVGTYPMTFLFIVNPNGGTYAAPAGPLNLTLASFANNIGEFMQGNFQGNYRVLDNVTGTVVDSTVHAISGTFRARRDY